MSQKSLNLSELLGSLSYALDLVEGQPPGHCLRCCWIGVHVGQQLGLSAQQLSELYYTLLMKDLGCSSNAARICQLYLTDDLSFKRDAKLIDGSLPQALRFVLTHTGVTSNFVDRVRALVAAISTSASAPRELVETRCDRGADIARMMRFSEPVAFGIRSLDEHWDGNGLPDGLAGSAIPIYSRIALLAQVVDVFQTTGGIEAARTEIRSRSGTWFDPETAAAFDCIAKRPEFWEKLNSPQLHVWLTALEPSRQVRAVDDDHLDDIASAFAKVVDSKSPFTFGHSERVTAYTDRIADQLGCSQDQKRILRRAALLHDIGKLGVSNSVLDKPGRLNSEEWEAIKRHPVYSEQILARVSVFGDIAKIAGAHHERLDGKGYPRGIEGHQISFATRIVTTADIFDALTADRPYRDAMPVGQALAIMQKDVGSAIDSDCFDALRASIDRAAVPAAA